MFARVIGETVLGEPLIRNAVLRTLCNGKDPIAHVWSAEGEEEDDDDDNNDDNSINNSRRAVREFRQLMVFSFHINQLRAWSDVLLGWLYCHLGVFDNYGPKVLVRPVTPI